VIVCEVAAVEGIEKGNERKREREREAKLF
jgi:hypothetical protein